MGEKTITCFVYPEPETEVESITRLIDSNLVSRVLSPLDYARMLDMYMTKCLVADTGKNVKGNKRLIAAEHFGISDSAAKRYINILRLPEKLQKYCGIVEFPYMALSDAIGCDETQIDEIEKNLGQNDLKFIG